MAKTIREDFSRFFEEPTRDRLRELLKNHHGEFDWLEFKEGWIEGTKLARHVLAMANSNGGLLVIGVKELGDKSLEPCGLAQFNDKTKVKQGIRKFVPDTVEFSILDFTYDESEYPKLRGKKFQVVMVEDRPDLLPFLCAADGESIVSSTIYVRDGEESKPVTHVQLQKILNRRIESMHSSRRELTLQEHLNELQALYKAIRPTISLDFGLALAAGLSVANPAFPKEGYEMFISRLIEEKKKVIVQLLTKTTR
ncbi:MAG: putative transcriptional regulator [Phycisphaerales bacterium]|nr:putative transcriptional regulator [Phycisphaerales bacterium]